MAPRPLLLPTTLALPTTALLLTTYLYGPLSKKTLTIRTSETLSPTASTSRSLHQIINPRHHISATDSRLITLSKTEIGNLTDEEILSRFLRGFFGGWVFWPERGVISVFGMLGRKMIAVRFSDIPTNGPQILSPAEISRTSLPEKFTVLLGGNFMVLDHHLNPPSPLGEEGQSPSFIEIGFGDNRKGFAGMHRFEVSRVSNLSKAENGKGGEDRAVELWYSSISCNPTVNKLPFPGWTFGFHKFYAQCLFKDGVAEVLRN